MHRSVRFRLLPAVAVGGAAAAAGHVHELQPATKHREWSRVEPEHRRRRGENILPTAVVQPAARGDAAEAGSVGELAAGVGGAAVGGGHGGAVRLEVHAVPPQCGVHRDGILPSHRQGRRGDAEAQHGPRPPPRLPQHPHLAPRNPGPALLPL